MVLFFSLDNGFRMHNGHVEYILEKIFRAPPPLLSSYYLCFFHCMALFFPHENKEKEKNPFCWIAVAKFPLLLFLYRGISDTLMKGWMDFHSKFGFGQSDEEDTFNGLPKECWKRRRRRSQQSPSSSSWQDPSRLPVNRTKEKGKRKK